MRIQVLQHAAFEGLGSIEPWLEARKAEIGYTRFFENPVLPAPDAADMIILMGGPMSVHEEEAFPWLAAEKHFIRAAAGRGIPMLGICLGAQLIAHAMGARVYRNRVKEIGWFPVRSVSAPEGCLHLPASCTAFHWHGETFDLPAGAQHLARSEACANQAFQLNRNIVGLQFHLEATPATVAALLEHCGDEIVPGPYVQSAHAVQHVPPAFYPAIHGVMDEVLSHLAAAS